MQYIATHIGEDHLEHYGVVGMKWGVRKDPDRAFGKGLSKITKYDAKARKYASKNGPGRYKKIAKLQKQNAKYMKRMAKAERKGNTGDYGKYSAKKMQNDTKLAKLNSKVAKYQAKEAKYQKKAAKVAKAMSRVNWSGVNMSSVNQSQLDIGKRYTSDLFRKTK